MTFRAIFAFLLSAWQPGLGQLYSGRPARAALHWFAVLLPILLFARGVLGRSAAALVAMVLIIAALRLASGVDAVLLKRRREKDSRKWFERWYLCLPTGLLLTGLALLALTRVQVLKSYVIPSVNMQPTLMVGDALVAALDAYDEVAPTRGDLVLIAGPGDSDSLIMKRVIGLPGERIGLHNRRTYIDGREIDEPWAVYSDSVNPGAPPSGDMPPLDIPQGHLFLMGDNRDYSLDSRAYGPLSAASVAGAPLFIYWANDRSRIGSRLE